MVTARVIMHTETASQMRIDPSCLAGGHDALRQGLTLARRRRARKQIAEHQRARHDHPGGEVIAIDEGPVGDARRHRGAARSRTTAAGFRRIA
jgi:hypothetical protein